MLKLAFLLVVIPSVVFATYGVDISSPVSKESFTCMRNAGYTFAVARAFESINQPDSNAPATIANAWAAGLLHVDVYIFPCPTCGNPAGQIQRMLSFLKSHGSRFGMVWLDIEGPQYWHSSTSENQAFFNGLVSELKNQNIHVGVYTSESQWVPIMGSSTAGSSYPLWYAHYDGAPNFNDFRSFGGWSKPSIKQFIGDATLCGAGVDKNFY